MTQAALRLIENDPPTILSVGTAVPPFRMEQQELAALAPRMFDRQHSEVDRLMPVFDNAGIATRYSCVPLDWYLVPHGWKERNALYLDNAVELHERSVTDQLDNAAVMNRDSGVENSLPVQFQGSQGGGFVDGHHSGIADDIRRQDRR